MACAAGATETEAEPEATTLPEATARAPLGNDRYVCAYYDAERATYTGTVAVLERADEIEAGTAGGSTYRLLVLTTHEDTAQQSPDAAGAPVLTGDQALALLRNAQAAQREGRATGEVYSGHAVREANRLRFTSADGHRTPRTMIVFTSAGLGIIESTAGRQGSASDGPYRCMWAAEPAAEPLLPDHCAQGRTGDVDIDGFPVPQAEVRLIQTALEDAGMTPGPIDGILGPRTLGALIRWNQQTERHRAPILAYETLCRLIETLGAEQRR